jgi:hypothetical protein
VAKLRPYGQIDQPNAGTYNGATEPMQEETIYDMDIMSYKAVLDKTGVREVKQSDFNYINFNLLIDM